METKQKTAKMLAILVLGLGLMVCPANATLTLPYYGTTSTDGKAFWVSNTYLGAGLTYGGFFYAAGEEGRGVFGQSMGSSGMGVKGWAANAGDVENYGGHFCATGERGIGVYGWAENTGDVENYGGFFFAEGNRGIGLFAMGGPAGLAGEFAGDIMITGAGNGIVFPDGTKQTSAGTGAGGLLETTVLNVHCAHLSSFSTSYAKILDVGSFTKVNPNSTIEITFNGRIAVTSSLTGTGAIFELRVDDAATTNGRARASFKSAEVGSFGVLASITGIFTGLSSGSHTVSIWVRTSYGTGSDAMVDPACWSSDHIVIKELL